MKHSAWNTCQQSLAFLKSSMQSLAFSPNCHLHCVFASYNSPGSFSGYLYSFMGFGRSARQVAWAVLEHRGAAGEARGSKGVHAIRPFIPPHENLQHASCKEEETCFFFFLEVKIKHLSSYFNTGATLSKTVHNLGHLFQGGHLLFMGPLT